MQEITLKQFLFTQPDSEKATFTTREYLRIANRLLCTWHNRALFQQAPDELKMVVCIALTGYYQDVIADAGVFRSFTDWHKHLYGHRLPFHDDSEDYIDYELNRADVEFVVWYQLAFNSMSCRFLYPRDPALLRLAEELYKVLEDEYDQVPDPQGYKEFFDCDLTDPADTEKIHDLSQWLFWKNWLLLPPFQLTFSQIYQQWVEIQHSAPTPARAAELIEDEKNKAMAELPTGPLALYLREWLKVILEGRIPTRQRSRHKSPATHIWYTAFIEATHGLDILFLKDYSELNSFLIDKLGWESGSEHLPQLKDRSYFVLMVTQSKGLMVAHDIARDVCHPLNPYYDREHAAKFAFNLLSQRAVCPGDMLRRFIAEDALPDARFPETDDTTLVCNNADFIARVYLQEFYRGDAD